jgi:hypothetical protein
VKSSCANFSKAVVDKNCNATCVFLKSNARQFGYAEMYCNLAVFVQYYLRKFRKHLLVVTAEIFIFVVSS